MKHATPMLQWIRFALVMGSAACMFAGGVPLASSGAGTAGDFGPMRFMLGTWTCSGAALDGTKFKVTDTTVMQGAGTSGQMVSHDSEGKSSTTMRWDSTTQTWLLTSESAKASSAQTSPGWSGDTLVFTGTISLSGAPTAGYRTTITRISDTQKQQVDELGNGGGQWITFATSSCEKGK
jgi:hypothetical protein